MKPSLVIFLIIIYANVASQVAVVGELLYTDSRWIVNEAGTRVKLACVNWPSHLEPVLAEGLDKKPVNDICSDIAAMGLNCVRFTWPLDLATNGSLAVTTVKRRLVDFGLYEALVGIGVHNPHFLELTIVQAFQMVVERLGENNVAVILDNHLTHPGWCCTDDDKSGFFGDPFFNPQLWLEGLTKMATMFDNAENVIGMSIRNELRGPNQNHSLWYRYMQEGAETVHQANPNVLVILSGLNFDTDLRFLRENPVEVSFPKKLVFEVHRYGFSDGNDWEAGSPNMVCGNFIKKFEDSAGFLLQQGFPLFVSEFGADLRGTNINDNRFMNCMFGLLADLDLDWAYWALQGSYYLREGAKDVDEVYGLYDKTWSGSRNLDFMVRLRSIQIPYQGPFDDVIPYNIVYHSSSGLCVLSKPKLGILKLGMCEASNPWIYDPTRKTIRLNGTDSCLQVVGLKQPVRLGINCTSPGSMWEMLPGSELQISSKLNSGERVCMDVSIAPGGIIISNVCRCVKDDPTCDPGSQWFKIISSSRRPLVPRTV